jgi:hypothetical protein
MVRMPRRRLIVFLVALAAGAAIAGFSVSSLSAQSASGALANFTPGQVKLFHTGGTVPNSQYADLGRLVLPVGSFVIDAHTVLRSQAPGPTGVNCYLVAPGTQAYTPIEITPDKGQNIKDLYASVVTTAPNGGNVDLLCDVSQRNADRAVFAQDTSIVAINVSGATVTRNPAPAVGSY